MFVGSSLIKMYVEANDIEEARKVFDRMPQRDCVIWNVLIDGYARVQDPAKSMQLFDMIRMPDVKPNSVYFACLLSVCASEGLCNYGIQIHGLAVKFGLDGDLSVADTLLAMYSKSSCLVDVLKLFESMPQTDSVAWNVMISGYAQNSVKAEALEVFYEMQAVGIKPDSVALGFLPVFFWPKKFAASKGDSCLYCKT